MGIFGPARLMPQPTSAALVAPTKVGAGYVPQPAPQGFFGRLRNMQTPEGVNPLMILGASLQEAGGQQGALQSVLESARALANDTAAQSWQREQQQRQRQEWAAGDAQTQRWQTALADMPPEERAQAEALGPTGFGTFLTNRRTQDNADRSYRLQERQLQEQIRNNNLDYAARAGARTGMPTLAEARQWTNSYNDDVRSTMNDLGNLRAAIPYANQVIQSNGAPTGNFRMNDVALLRAAARAQTGPGVLTEGEVFGTLSPSLQQDLTRNASYLDIAVAGIRPEDRLALARYVQMGQSNASRDLWRRYQGAEDVLVPRGIRPDQVGIAAPEYVHPEDQAAFDAAPAGSLRQGQEYTAPSGRSYRYDGPGRYTFIRRAQYNRERRLNAPNTSSTDSTRGTAANPIRLD